MAQKNQAKLVAAVILTLLVLILVIQNMGLVGFQIYFWRASVPAALAILVTFLAGFAAGKLG